MIFEFPLHLPRNAFTPRNSARAGDVWRLLQDAAMFGSAAAGWPPHRYRAEGIAFVVREMTVVHHREAVYGENLTARTCIGEFRRGLLSTRQVRIAGDGGPLVSAAQEWAHVKVEGDRMRPARAGDELIAAFHVDDGLGDVSFPEVIPENGADTRAFSFRCWHTWMDPLAHANHPAYVDWCDEALSVAMHRAGLDPVALQPVAEWVKWRSGVEAPAEITVETTLIGRAGGDPVCEHRILADGDHAATARTVRGLVDGGTDALVHALR